MKQTRSLSEFTWCRKLADFTLALFFVEKSLASGHTLTTRRRETS